METKKKIELAAELLRNAFGYVNGAHTGGLAYDFIVDEDDESIDVFNVSHDRETFFWPDAVVDVCRAVNLCCYACYSRVVDEKRQVVMRIH